MENINYPELELVRTSLKRYTFEAPKMKTWVEENSHGYCLNLFAGKTKLNLNEMRVDIDASTGPNFCTDTLDFVKYASESGMSYSTIILDPPYSYRKSMEMYKGHLVSPFAQLADIIPSILEYRGKVISFGYHSTFLGKKRGFLLTKLCVFAHGGAQHCTIGIVEERQIDQNIKERVK